MLDNRVLDSDLWQKLYEHDDGFTVRHSLEVTSYFLAGTRFLVRTGHELPASQDTLREMALLHDIGKFGVSPSILRKPGGLDDYEFEAIKLHPRLGLQYLAQLPFKVEPIVRVGLVTHHNDFLTLRRSYPPVFLSSDLSYYMCWGYRINPETSLITSTLSAADALDASTNEDRKLFDNFLGLDRAQAVILGLIEKGKFSPFDSVNKILPYIFQAMLDSKKEKLKQKQVGY